MIILKIWDKKEGFNLADGTPATVEEIYEQFPFTKSDTTVLEYLANGNVGAVDSLTILKEVFKIEPNLTDEEAIAEIKRIKELPPEPVVDEVVAKLDYLVMMNGGI